MPPPPLQVGTRLRHRRRLSCWHSRLSVVCAVPPLRAAVVCARRVVCVRLCISLSLSLSLCLLCLCVCLCACLCMCVLCRVYVCVCCLCCVCMCVLSMLCAVLSYMSVLYVRQSDSPQPRRPPRPPPPPPEQRWLQTAANNCVHCTWQVGQANTERARRRQTYAARAINLERVASCCLRSCGRDTLRLSPSAPAGECSPPSRLQARGSRGLARWL